MERSQGIPAKKRAVPPDLIGMPLSKENATWLATQQQKERDHKRRVIAARYTRERELGLNRKAYGASTSTAISAVRQQVEVETVESEQSILDIELTALLIGAATLSETVIQTQQGEA